MGTRSGFIRSTGRRSRRRAAIVVGAMSAGLLLGGVPPTLASSVHGHAARRSATAPSMAQIANRLRHTVEIGTKGEYFRALGKPLTIKDGRGTGTLTAIVGGRYPTADALGQIVFFWHNKTFIGLSSKYETFAVEKLGSHGAGNFVIKYAQYKRNDPACCPTLPPRTVSYGWSGHILISNGVPPKEGGKPLTVAYRP